MKLFRRNNTKTSIFLQQLTPDTLLPLAPVCGAGLAEELSYVRTLPHIPAHRAGRA